MMKFQMFRKTVPLVLSSFIFATISWSARADTYNFFFEPKKKGAAVEEHEEGMPTPVPPVTTTTAAPQGQPIIINNNLSAPTVTPSPSPMPVPMAPSPAPAQNLVGEFDLGGKWGLEFSGISTPKPDLIAQEDYSVHYTKPKVAGLMLSLTYRVLPALGARLYGGIFRRVAKEGNSDELPLFGADADFYPVRFGWAPVNFIELGLLAGVNNIGSEASRLSGHVGIRANANLSQAFGVTGSVRLSTSFVVAEFGLVSRL